MGCSAAKPAASPERGAKRLLEEYSVGQTLGEGAFGVVYACTNRATGQEVAVKMVDKVETPVEAIRKEAELQKSLDHVNIVKVIAVFYERCFVCIVMDKYSGGDLVEGLHLQLKERGKINCFDIVHISRQMALSIQYLHQRQIAHRDVKGDNYMMSVKTITDLNCVVALADFGTAVVTKPGERLNTEVGTRIFWSPEFYNKNYGMKVDVWAMGVIMYGLLDGRFPFKDENDIKKKELKMPKTVHPDCEQYVRGMLTKDEAKRLDADQVVEHKWITTTGVTGSREKPDGSLSESTQSTDANSAAVRVDGADDGVAERRRELLERLNKDHQDKGQKGGKKKTPASQHYWAKWFTIVDKHQAGSTLKFEWWDENQVNKTGILKFEGTLAKGGANDQIGKSPELVGKQLAEHNIDISQFGKGEAKSLPQMASEVASGSARLMLDASEHKKLVRVVDIVLLRIYNQANKAKILVETAEQYPDGRKRNTGRLPGTKKDPHESSKETAYRILKDLMNMGDCKISFDYDAKEVFEEESESPSYPGVKTVYKKEVIEGYIVDTDKDALAAIGLPAATSTWSASDSKQNTKFFSWMTDKQASAKGVKMSASGSEEVSGLVAAPLGFNEEDLTKYLQKYNVDISLFGKNNAKSLKEFSSELIKGEASLIENGKGGVVRIVDLIILKIVNPGTGDVLVQTEQTFGDGPGTKNVLNRLPGAKRRPDENQFLTARRLLRKQLKIDENNAVLDPENVTIYEEEKPSQAFPAVQTVYRRRIIRVDLVK
jgi:serine/threonine protein kinase